MLKKRDVKERGCNLLNNTGGLEILVFDVGKVKGLCFLLTFLLTENDVGNLNSGLTDVINREGILLQHVNDDLISGVEFTVDEVKILVPNWLEAGTIVYLGLLTILSQCDLHEWILLSESVTTSCQLGVHTVNVDADLISWEIGVGGLEVLVNSNLLYLLLGDHRLLLN